MKRMTLVPFLVLALFVSPQAQSKPKDPASIIQALLEKGAVEKEPLKALDGLKKVYEKHPDGIWSTRARADFIRWLPGIGKDGLVPQWYHAEKIKDLSKKDGQDDLARLDVLLTDAALTVASNLAFGLNITGAQKYDWYKEGPMNQILEDLAKSIESRDVTGFLENLPPNRDVRYAQLKKSLQRYEKIARKGNWTVVTRGDKLQEGDEDIRVRLLKKRLIAEGYLEERDEKDPGLFDAKLKEALMEFQKDHSLEPDGVAGAQTVEALNIPVAQKILQMRVSLDRLREILPSLPEHYLLVNIPAFRLWVYEGNNAVVSMKVVAGRKDRRTPLMEKEMQYLVFSPAWHVPYSIAIKDKLPEIVKDPSFIEKNNMVLTKKGEDGAVHVVDASTVDWAQVTAENFDYQLTQKPGDGNALGKVKFIFPNTDNIYLHDTSQPELFAKDIRSYSSGCIRIEKPLELAEYVLQDQEDWDKHNIQGAMDSGNQKIVPLRKRIPVYLTYFTAWGDEAGGVSFGTDIYGFDKKVAPFFEAKK